MKKVASVLLLAAIAASLPAGCARTDDSAARVGDVLEAPEKTVSLDALDCFTFTVTQEETDGSGNVTWQEEFYEAYRKDSDKSVYYLQFISGESVAEDAYFPYANLCVTADGQDTYYFKDNAEDSFQIALPYEGEPVANNSKEFLSMYARYGIDYADWLECGGFEKREDARVGDRECFVYKVSYTERVYGAEEETYQSVDSVIYVDKETGLWIKREISDVQYGSTCEITDIRWDADIIPALE